MKSLWRDAPLDIPTQPPLTDASHHEVVVVGAGLTGLATAHLLATAGRQVTVVEAREVGAGTTGGSTAKVSLLQGTALSQLRARHSEAVVRAYVRANTEGQEWLNSTLTSLGAVPERRDAWTYAVTPSGSHKVADERDAARALGLPVDAETASELPFAVRDAVVLRDQAQIDPMRALAVLARAVADAGGIIVTGHLVTSVDGHGPLRVGVRQDDDPTEPLEITADTVVLATGCPILDRGLHFARLEPHRSYGLAFDVSGPVPQGMYLSADAATRSLRSAPGPGHSVRLLVGGEGHVTGREGSEQHRVDRLTAWARAHFPVTDRTHAWSAQDYRSLDRLPIVGHLPGGHGRIHVATGFNKWGMTNGAAAALAIAGDILGTPRAWAGEVYHERAQLSSIADALRTNGQVAAAMVSGWTSALMTSEPPPGEGQGRVVRRGGRPVAVCTVDGVTHEVSGVCTHLGGIVAWNDAERSWDCPLHGSRFDADGRRLEGPATADLGPES